MTIPALLESVSGTLEQLGVEAGVRLEGLPVESLPLLLTHLSVSSGLPALSSLLSAEDALFLHDAIANTRPGGRVAFYPGRSVTDSIPGGFSAPLEDYRLAALAALAADELPHYFLFTSVILAEGLPSAGAIRGSILKVRPGDITYTALRSWLFDNDYDSAPLVTEPGCFALRGSVIDCYPVNSQAPVRFDFLGDQLEEIRAFDIHSQISTNKLEAADLLSRAVDENGSSPVFDHFPGGWILFSQEDQDSWSLTSQAVSDTDRTVDLRIEPFSGQPMTAELLRARWDLLVADNPNTSAFFICDRPAQFERALTTLLGIPFEHLHGVYPSGFSSAPLGLLVLTPAELSSRRTTVWRSRRKPVASRSMVQQHIDSLEPNDLIVHVNYGIGRYLGLTNLDVSGTLQECLTIEYAGNDRVYVSTDMIGLVLPYTVEEGRQIELDSLHSSRWERVKRSTRRSAEAVVEELAQLYASRATATGHAHAADDEFQVEFEESFPYEDTPDQVRATEEIKHDLELPRPMDRLLCGDVGFGKTELALRAAFKAIRGGFQVALLAPTTILADQHFISFRARLEPFAVNVQMLSRFVTASNQRRILKELSSGSVDLVVGTHRLLSKDVAFRRLGLLIIDEEQRFGVRQKERIKELKANLDVLSLSATPIPRTLHFSLAGIREISRLDTPPLERIPIITSIHYFNRDLIRSAVIREIDRAGQVYFVHSEVKSIERVARDLRELLPEVTIAVAHGQMDARELENTMLAFSDNRFQLLVCTSIIESGIDLPNVNTLIINNAHRFGLAQLYQIRGRVGRSSRQAYAFLLIPDRPKPSHEALKRLKTIERYTALGSGYAIALKDLEIRGAGNLFGLEQSGHVAAVGLDLYSRIIQGVARERELLPGNGPPLRLSREDVTIRIFPLAGIPEQYVPDPHLRLNLYRRLSLLDSQEDLERFRVELNDRFGVCPQEVKYLLQTVKFCIAAMAIGARSTRLSDADQLHIDFIPPENPASFLKRIQDLLEPIGCDYRFINLKQEDLRLSIHIGNKEADFIVEYLFNSLEVNSKA